MSAFSPTPSPFPLLSQGLPPTPPLPPNTLPIHVNDDSIYGPEPPIQHWDASNPSWR
ncbi:MAG: hypothetical protein Q9169_003691 [Polycauliona sp. 2 TL-2023]